MVVMGTQVLLSYLMEANLDKQSMCIAAPTDPFFSLFLKTYKRAADGSCQFCSCERSSEPIHLLPHPQILDGLMSRGKGGEAAASLATS